jgi:hypothetical protein
VIRREKSSLLIDNAIRRTRGKRSGTATPIR